MQFYAIFLLQSGESINFVEQFGNILIDLDGAILIENFWIFFKIQICKRIFFPRKKNALIFFELFDSDKNKSGILKQYKLLLDN